MISLDPTNRITIAGLPGTGKTTFGRWLADYFSSEEGTSILIWDPMGLYRTFKDEELYLPRNDTPAEFESVCRRLCEVGNTVFIIEEAESYLRQGMFLGTYAFTLAQRGRNWGNGMVAITRRIQDLSKSYFQICQHCFFFRCHPMIRDYVKGFLEPEAIRLLFTLKKYHFLYYNMETHEYEVSWLDLGGDRPHIKPGKTEELEAVPRRGREVDEAARNPKESSGKTRAI